MGSPFHHTYIVYTLPIVFMFFLFGSVSGWIDSNIYSLSALISSSKIDETERKKYSLNQIERATSLSISLSIIFVLSVWFGNFIVTHFDFLTFRWVLGFCVSNTLRLRHAMPCHAKFAHKLKHQIDMDIHIDLYWTTVPFPLFLKSCIINTKHKLTTITRISYGWLFLKSRTFKCSFHVEHLIENSEREKKPFDVSNFWWLFAITWVFVFNLHLIGFIRPPFNPKQLNIIIFNIWCSIFQAFLEHDEYADAYNAATATLCNERFLFD